jgi:hypothetical protein
MLSPVLWSNDGRDSRGEVLRFSGSRRVAEGFSHVLGSRVVLLANLLVIALLRLLEQTEESLEQMTESGIPGLAHSVVGNDKGLSDNFGHSVEPLVGEETHKYSPGETGQRGDDGDGPLGAFQAARNDMEGTRANEDDQHLETNHEDVNEDEELVAVNALENVELVVQTSVVKLVEDLYPDEGVENDGIELERLFLNVLVVSKDGRSGEVQNEGDDKLEDGLPDDHLPHVGGDEGGLLALGRAVENLLSRGIDSKGESSKGIHDEIDPEELDRLEHGNHVRMIDSGDEGKKHSGNVDCELELEEWLLVHS